jgi:hypothetical protein
VGLGLCLGASLLGAEAHAQARCPAMPGASAALADVDAEARLAFLRGVMTDQAARARTWTWAWSGIGFGLAAGQYALIPLVPRDKRFEEAFEGTAALYIPAGLAVLPLRVRSDRATLEQLLADTETPAGPMAPCLRVERAEELVALTADDEAAHTNVLQHVVTIVLSAGYAAILGFGFNDKVGMAWNGGSAVVLGEAQLLTSPTGAVSALERYRRGDLGIAALPRVAFGIEPLGVAPGLALVARF